MDTPRDIAKRHRPGRPMEDELEDAIARHVLDKDKRIAQLEAMLRAAGYNDAQIKAGTPYVELMGG